MNGSCNCGLTGGCWMCNPNVHNPMPKHSITGLPLITPVYPGWICPRCKRVWGPSIGSCWNCNILIDNGMVPQ